MATQKRRIVGGIMQGTKIYKAGDEDALAEVLGQRQIQRLIEKGQLEGDWGVPVVVRVPDTAVVVTKAPRTPTVATIEAKAAEAEPAPRKPAVRRSKPAPKTTPKPTPRKER